MAYPEPSEKTSAAATPALMMGAVSPLWTYFGAAAAGGLAFWWMTRWARPANLEALLGGSRPTPDPLPVLEPMGEAAEVAAESMIKSMPDLTVTEPPEPVAAEPEPGVEPEPAPPATEPMGEPTLVAAPVPEPDPAAETAEDPAPQADFAPPLGSGAKARAKKPQGALREPEA